MELILNSTISHYESGEREPPLPVLLAYAKLANVYVDVLIDDELDLPEQIPSREKSSGILKIG
jgi:transcriptional regulator with XRE-family HTH domain